MRFFVGTSGYSYKEWKGTFYPEKLPQKEMLRHYAGQFSAVEINNTFNKLPGASVVGSWVQQTSNPFRFVLKAPKSITHFRRFKDVEQVTDQLLQTASVLAEKRGPLLFQLPPNFKKDVARLDAFLNSLGNVASAFEFRHESWFGDEVVDCLRAHSCALCVADGDKAPSAPLVDTASWGYVRLRGEGYTDQQLRMWIKKLRSQAWSEAYVFFKHEDSGAGPKLAARLLELAGP
jgi:uncharacterized protein YecE (DUF72 family)